MPETEPDPEMEMEPGIEGEIGVEIGLEMSAEIEPEPGLDEPLPEAPLRAILEALLFASDEPVTPEEIRAILGEDRGEEIDQALSQLSADYLSEGRGLRVQAIAGGFRIATDPALGPFVRELVRTRNRQKLSRAALETLAIVAYKQPITAPEIQDIRGVNPSAILSALLDRRLVRILGRKKVVGKPFIYGTSRDFLVRFGLNSLQDLPSMEEFDAMLQERAPLHDAELPLEPAELPTPEDASAPKETGADTAAP